MVNFSDPAYGFNPQATPGGPPPSSFVPFGQQGPSRPGPLSTLGLALVAGLAGGRDPQQGMAEAGQNAQFVKAKLLADDKKAAINAWLKAGAPKDVQHPATQALFAAAPEIAQASIAHSLVPTEPTDLIQNYQYAKQQGFGGSIVDFQQQSKGPLVSVDTGLGSLPSVGLADVGKPDPAAQSKYLAALPPDTAKLVKSIADYQMDISKVTSLRGGEREQIAKLVAGYDPTFDMTQYPTRAAMRKSVTSGSYSQAMNSANLLIQHADALQKAADDLSNWSMPSANAVKNLWNQETGDPRISKFETAKKAVAAEAAKVFKGTGASSEREIQDWESQFSASSSPEQIKASIQTLVGDLLKSRLDTIRSQFESAMGKPAAFTMLTPHSRQVLEGLGLDPAALDNPGAAQAPAGALTAVPAQAAPQGAVTHTWDPQNGLRQVGQ